MRDAPIAETALGFSDRGVVGGFAASLLRALHADADLAGDARSWAMAALTSYSLKSRADRRDVCGRLLTVLPAGKTAPGPRTSLQESIDVLPGVGGRVLERLASLKLETIGDLLDHFPRDY